MCSSQRYCRHDLARESIHALIERIPPGTQFTLMDIFRGNRFGPSCCGTFSMLYNTIREAVDAGLLERAGRYPSQGSPVLYRKPGCLPAPARPVVESMQPPRGWRRPAPRRE